MLLDGNSAVGLIGGKVARVSSVSEPFTICAKHKRKKNSQEKLLGNEATMGNIINSLCFYSYGYLVKLSRMYILKVKGCYSFNMFSFIQAGLEEQGINNTPLYT